MSALNSAKGSGIHNPTRWLLFGRILPDATTSARTIANMAVQRVIVANLERLCALLDNIPFVWRESDGWHFYRHGCLGCYPLRLAQRSADLDDRWGTGVW